MQINLSIYLKLNQNSGTVLHLVFKKFQNFNADDEALSDFKTKEAL